MPKVDLDFQRYVERRKGAREAQTREGAAYAYAGDLKVLRTLDRLRPVRVSVEASVRLWNTQARSELLGAAVKVSPLESPQLHATVAKCAELLRIAPPTVYLAPELGPLTAQTFGTNEDAYLVLSRERLASLSELELLHVIGRECGRVQNNHVVYATSLYYLTHFASRLVKWAVTPAVMALTSWSHRAEITLDRAGLLCTRALDVSEAAIGKLGGDPKRIDALRLFADSAYYKGLTKQEGGLPAAECDAKVAEVLK
jgi:hypothetical protein